jgi:hypothetical protein
MRSRMTQSLRAGVDQSDRWGVGAVIMRGGPALQWD